MRIMAHLLSETIEIKNNGTIASKKLNYNNYNKISTRNLGTVKNKKNILVEVLC